MRVGVPRERKNHEYRVAITPAGVRELHLHGHEVLIERNAGRGSQISDDEYADAGARLVASAEEVWGEGELVLKVKEPIAAEYGLMREGQVLFTYLHLAASRSCTEAIIDAKTTAVAYEMVQSADGSLPLLAPMSEVAGCLAPQVAAHYLMKPSGGKGVLLGGVAGVHSGRVVVIGAGVSGVHAARIAVGLAADVRLLDINVDALRAADRYFRGDVQTIVSSTHAVEEEVLAADVVIGAVLVPGAKAPVVVSNDLVARMRPGSVLVDIAVDQGGCFEDTRPTTHDDPTYQVHDCTFYAVSNMPGAVPNTSTYALTNVTLPYAVALADKGFERAVHDNAALAAGVNAVDGQLTAPAVAAAHDLPSVALGDVL
ncbi:alanine dehydrogenase [Epidermidibacterium keratini]|uniref:Alanine dehydrogenase n=1 Tax=Epidermidibacterium keratini TaxID=1891644 RepID=A0A7L4YH33_9ACTN|nr:alanine dehydrogenase [Epidermidibacterium keratini]QHB98924.1 alanine dehydrogenase [Epidermidibacterium keratini]